MSDGSYTVSAFPKVYLILVWKKHLTENKHAYKFLLCIPLVLLLLFMPGNGGTPFNEPSPLLPSDGAPLREDSPPADLDSKQEKITVS